MTRWSADPSSHWTRPKPHSRHSHLLTGEGSSYPNPPTSYLWPPPLHPLLQLPTRQAGPLEPQPGCREGPRPGPRGRGAGCTTPPRLRAGTASHTLRPATVPGGCPRRGKGREKDPVLVPLPRLHRPRASFCSEHSSGRPKQPAHKHLCLLGQRDVPTCTCVCLRQRKERRGPRKPQDSRPLPVGLTATSPPTAAGYHRWPGSAAQHPGAGAQGRGSLVREGPTLLPI